MDVNLQQSAEEKPRRLPWWRKKNKRLSWESWSSELGKDQKEGKQPEGRKRLKTMEKGPMSLNGMVQNGSVIIQYCNNTIVLKEKRPTFIVSVPMSDNQNK